jgi:signal transduction histidine kinase
MLDVNVTQLSQVFVNLINNSVDAIEELAQKWIKFEMDEDKDYITIKVSDSGKGIPIDIQEKMFKPFFTTKGLGKGTGLGVGICNKIVTKIHKGEFYIDNQSVNTTFVVKLPKNISKISNNDEVA